MGLSMPSPKTGHITCYRTGHIIYSRQTGLPLLRVGRCIGIMGREVQEEDFIWLQERYSRGHNFGSRGLPNNLAG